MQVYKAIKYIRLSYTDDKTVESDSVANQRRLIDDYIARHPEIEVVAEKIDDGYSGVLFDRPAFQEMMRMIEQGEANLRNCKRPFPPGTRIHRNWPLYAPGVPGLRRPFYRHQ